MLFVFVFVDARCSGSGVCLKQRVRDNLWFARFFCCHTPRRIAAARDQATDRPTDSYFPISQKVAPNTILYDIVALFRLSACHPPPSCPSPRPFWPCSLHLPITSPLTHRASARISASVNFIRDDGECERSGGHTLCAMPCSDFYRML